MGLGFTNNDHSNNGAGKVMYQTPVHTNDSKTDVWKVIRGITAVVTTIVMLSGLIWGGATLFAGTASDGDLDTVKDRVEELEKHDVKQTLIMEYIKESLEKIDKKLDKLIGH